MNATCLLLRFLFSDSKAVFSRCDVTDWDEQLKLFDVAEQKFGVVRPSYSR